MPYLDKFTALEALDWCIAILSSQRIVLDTDLRRDSWDPRDAMRPPGDAVATPWGRPSDPPGIPVHSLGIP